MGLDISVITKWGAPDGALNEEFEDQNGDPAWGEGGYDWNIPEYLTRSAGLPEGPVIIVEQGEGFSAGPYSYYNRWRNYLAKLAGYPELTEPEPSEARYFPPRTGHDVGAWMADDGPFWELINFSDCEGFLGPAVCKKLIMDFDEFASQAKACSADTVDFPKLYESFHQAIKEVVASNGALHFS